MSHSEIYTKIASYLQEAEETRWHYEQVLERFQAVPAPTYGDSMPKWVPDYEYANNLMLDIISLNLPKNGKILDLGAGTGRFSKRVLERFHDCHVTLVDFSENMLQGAAEKLTPFKDRCETIQADFFDANLNFPNETFDCVISVFAICHGRELENYQKLYAKIFRWLKPSSYFVCYDHVRGNSLAFTTLNAAGWYNFIIDKLAEGQVKEAIVSTYQEDTPLSLPEHLETLTQAGFRHADVLFKKDIFAIYTAVKNA